MNLVLSISKMDVDKISDLNSKLLPFCETAIEKEESIIYVPLGGKLLTVINLLSKHGINYQLRKISATGDQV
jgi:hypothetical protein